VYISDQYVIEEGGEEGGEERRKMIRNRG